MRAEELSLRATVPPAEVPGYRLDRLLGQGAFGQVWVAQNSNTGRTVAIKFYLHRGGVDWTLLAREVKHLVSMASNRFIVQVLEVGWDAEPPYYVMEFIENGSLDDLIRSRGSLGVKQAVDLIKDIAIGLNHSHAKGVLHCDLKPANVLLDQDMKPRLADFGQSRMSHEQTPSLGTLFYMAPEQADLSAIPDAGWDVYALGAILYCMLVGSPPHRSQEMVSVLDTAANLPERLNRYRQAIETAPAPKLHTRVSGVDRDLAGIIDGCLQANPEDRYANVQQVLEALQRRESRLARRPLMLLGIVGPLLLLVVMSVFVTNQLFLIREQNSKRLKAWSLQSNAFAAKFAARSLEVEISGVFQLLSDESMRPVFRTVLDDAISATVDERAGLQTRTPDSQLLSRFRETAEIERLSAYLRSRLQRLDSERKIGTKRSRFSSLFVLDTLGNNVGIAIEDEHGELPTGLNFAYREYFHALPEEPTTDTDPKALGPTLFPHLSAPFRSTSTGYWKVALSSPIYDHEDEMGDGAKLRGLLVITINIGDFDLMPGQSQGETEGDEEDVVESATTARHAVLVGNVQQFPGQILQHPYFHERGKKRADKDLVKIDPDMLEELKSGTYRYRDPVAGLSGGEIFEGEWVASMQRVDFSFVDSGDAEARRSPSDLWVIVQERADHVTSPVMDLVRGLLKEWLIAILTLLIIMVVLWLFVLRVIQLPEVVVGLGKTRLSDDTNNASSTVSFRSKS